MAKFNKYVKIGPPIASAAADEVAMVKVLEKYKNVVAVLEDVAMPGLEWFKKNAPERIVECGIAEGNAAVIAGGLAAEGFTPFIHGFTFACVGRAYNQIRQSILVDHFNVKITSREVWGELGVSHNVVEGIGSLRVLPNLIILNAADFTETEKAFIAMADYIGPVFFRMESQPPMQIFTKDYPFEIGKAYAIKDGKDATIIATGYMVTEAIKAIDILEKDGLDVGIINMSTLKPLDEEAIIKAAEDTRAIVTAESGSIIGGLGEGVAAILAENSLAVLVRVGIDDEFGQSAKTDKDPDDLMVHFGMTPEDLAASVKECIAKKEKFKLRGKKSYRTRI
jgi:transketolase